MNHSRLQASTVGTAAEGSTTFGHKWENEWLGCPKGCVLCLGTKAYIYNQYTMNFSASCVCRHEKKVLTTWPIAPRQIGQRSHAVAHV
jgi:hypothetical protein